MNHLEERNLVNSLLSNERFSFLKQKKNLIDYDISNISKWLNLKSLVKENELNERLKYEKIDKNDFNLGIKKLDDNEKDFLLNYIKKMDWFQYFEIYEKTIISAIREADFDNNMSAYGGKVSILFPIIREIQKTGKSNFSYYINEIKSFIKENINNFQELDWLSGYSGVIALMLNIYEVLNDKECLDIAIQLGYKICHNIDIKNFNIIGYAHGCSGIAIALSRLYNYCCNELFINKAYKLIEKERMLIKDNNYKINSKWCSGYTGIGLSRLELYKKYNDSTMLDEIEYSVNII